MPWLTTTLFKQFWGFPISTFSMEPIITFFYWLVQWNFKTKAGNCAYRNIKNKKLLSQVFLYCQIQIGRKAELWNSFRPHQLTTVRITNTTIISGPEPIAYHTSQKSCETAYSFRTAIFVIGSRNVFPSLFNEQDRLGWRPKAGCSHGMDLSARPSLLFFSGLGIITTSFSSPTFNDWDATGRVSGQFYST